ncbi:MAG: BON domain-containing protein [Fibrobacter sp.]|nr:BON domain-containing protein [Fibrobacter sp.]
MAGNQEILNNVISQLRADSRIDKKQVHVELIDSEVTLSGTVESLAALVAAEDAARSVSGVGRVSNLLKIRYPDEMERLTDDKIADSVRNRLSLDRNIKSDFIRVSAEEGIVTLKGSVESYRAREHCGKSVSEVQGVVQVINDLAVVPTHKFADNQIATEINESLSRIDISVENITVRVEEGIVTLSGKVPHWNSYYSVEYAAKNTRGVKGVVNELILA